MTSRRPQSSKIYSIFESANTRFIAVLADIYRTVLLTPRSWWS